jgi:pimeloyl-ACP methyl ester carboxylesterase
MAPALQVEITGAGAPLVLIHGIATDSNIWAAVLPELARERTVVAVDLPGFGRSKPVGEGFELPEVAAAILAGLAERGVSTPFDLVGHSLGGGVAIQFAAQHPAAVRRLVLVAPAGLRPFPPALTALLSRGQVVNFVSSGADALFAARRGAAPLAELGWGRRLLLGLAVADGANVPPAVARGMLDASLNAKRTGPALATITTTDMRPLLAQITAPLGVIWGEADRTVPIRALEDLLQARPDAEVIRLPEIGHAPMVEAPDTFTTALLALISQDPNCPEPDPISG